MSFIVRSASFYRVAQGSKSQLVTIGDKLQSVEKHKYFFDVDACSILSQNWNNPKLSLSRLSEMGGVQGLAKAFRTDLRNGIFADEHDFTRRNEEYGKNIFIKKPPRNFFLLCCDELKAPIIIVLIIAGLISLVVQSVKEPKTGWVEGTAILIAIFVVVIIGSMSNYKKELQFRSLDAKKDIKNVIVVRAAKEIVVPNTEVVVGDIVVLQTGVSIPCDGVWVTGTESLQSEESSLTGESRNITKNFDFPFLLAGTQIVDGEGVMLATAVGIKTTWGSLMSRLDEKRPETPLQEKLKKMAKFIGYGGFIAAGSLFVILLIRWIIDTKVNNKDFGQESMQILDFLLISITIIVVAVPEGLPLSVTLSLAFSMKKMVKDNNFVRHLSACETMGNVTTICSDKTGTLTLNQMSVCKAWPEKIFTVKDDSNGDDVRFPVFESKNSKISSVYKDTLLEGIALNSKVFEKKRSDWKNKNKMELTGGNETECALLAWAIKLGVDYLQVRKKFPIEKAYPFSSKTKRSSVLIRYKGKYRMYLKGAAERIFSDFCTSILTSDGKKVDLTPQMRSSILSSMDKMVSSGLRCICIAYRDYDHIEYDRSADPVPIDPPFEEFTCIAISGIKDPVRPEVPSAVLKCQQSGIIVRMVTGDHPKTAEFIAAECGIRPKHRKDLLVLTGDEFRSMSPEQLEEVLPKLRVLARSTPSDKEKLVRWYMDHDEIVAVTGDGANDALALKEAHVGLSMGIQGTDVAKEASDIIILDDSFLSIVETVKWGRSVFDNIRKFLQFQLTINSVALAISLIGAIAGFHTPLSPVQLLWINMIMDTLAALALATEEPTHDLLRRRPYARDCGLISPLMCRSIIGQGLVQLLILLLMIFPLNNPIGVKMFSINETADIDKRNNILRTCLFNTFVWLQIFNSLNARKINNEINVFKNITKNGWFISIFALIICIQIIYVNFFGSFGSVVRLNWLQWLICISLGSSMLLVGFLLHFVPVDENYGFIESYGDIDLAQENEMRLKKGKLDENHK